MSWGAVSVKSALIAVKGRGRAGGRHAGQLSVTESSTMAVPVQHSPKTSTFTTDVLVGGVGGPDGGGGLLSHQPVTNETVQSAASRSAS